MEDLSFPETNPRARDEHHFRRIFEAAPFAILEADDEGRYLDANPMACRLFGLTRHELIGRHVHEFVDRDELGAVQSQWRAFRSDGEQSGEFRLCRPDGTRRLLRYRALADLAPGRHVSFLEDVTEVRAAEEAREAAERERAAARRALEASESRFRTLADGLPLVIWLADAEGRTLYLNRHWSEYTGLPQRPDALGNLEDAVHADDRPRVVPLLREGRERGEPLEVTFRIRRHDGEYRWHLCRALSLRDDHGRITRRLASATEIEEERRTLERLRLERELRERFVAMLSHDLRSPLSAVKMSAQLLLLTPPDAGALAARILRNADHADELIQNLLDASRITAGEPLPVRRSEGDLGAVARQVIADQSAVHGPRFLLEERGSLNGVFDGGAIRRVLENLLANAVKYGDPQAPVLVRVAGHESRLTLEVRNQGNPIPPAERERIFTPYHRSRATSAGWGLGLTLVRGVAEAHGGEVRVESAPEIGTTFTVTLQRGEG